MGALTGLVSIVLFLPCIFKEFSTQNKTITDGNAEEDTTETLKIAEAEGINKNSNSRPETNMFDINIFDKLTETNWVVIFILATSGCLYMR